MFKVSLTQPIVSFHCQLLNCGQYRVLPMEINFKKSNVKLIARRGRENVASTFSMHCEKASDVPVYCKD